MLSFFRTKSSEATVDKIINGTKHLSVEVAEIATPKNTQIMQSTTTNPDNQKSDPNALLRSLGYKNDVELKETIYGDYKYFLFLFYFNVIKIEM